MRAFALPALILLAICVHAEPVDTDGDGLSDVEEAGRYGTDPYVGDSDGDGFGDGLEVGMNSDPLSASNTPRTDPDSDGDELSDYAEVFSFFTNPIISDTDEDGTLDGQEISEQTFRLILDGIVLGKRRRMR